MNDFYGELEYEKGNITGFSGQFRNENLCNSQPWEIWVPNAVFSVCAMIPLVPICTDLIKCKKSKILNRCPKLKKLCCCCGSCLEDDLTMKDCNTKNLEKASSADEIIDISMDGNVNHERTTTEFYKEIKIENAYLKKELKFYRGLMQQNYNFSGNQNEDKEWEKEKLDLKKSPGKLSEEDQAIHTQPREEKEITDRGSTLKHRKKKGKEKEEEEPDSIARLLCNESPNEKPLDTPKTKKQLEEAGVLGKLDDKTPQ